MTVYEGCRIRVRGGDAAVLVDVDDGEVTRDGDRLAVVYWDDEGAVVFAGTRDEDGSYALVCRSRPRRASLCWSRDGQSLDGTWSQHDETGTWTIVIGSPEPS